MQPVITTTPQAPPVLPLRLMGIVIGVFFILLGVSLIRTWNLSRLARQSLQQQQERVRGLEKAVQNLETEVQTATSSFTLEQRARDELHRQRPNETIIETRPQ
jgi:cell division protein FtsB